MKRRLRIIEVRQGFVLVEKTTETVGGKSTTTEDCVFITIAEQQKLCRKVHRGANAKALAAARGQG